MKKSRFLLIGLVGIVLVSTLFAQEKGRVNGLVIDKSTDEPLAGVNILVKGTYFGASTDLDGFFLIPDIDAGEYELEVSYIGYKIIVQTGVTVTAGEAINLQFALEASVLALGQDIEVIGKKPLMDIEETSTIRSLSNEDIENRIVNDALELVSQQVGVVRQDNEIHIRGGRSYEAQYLLDGISIQDPLAGTGYGLNLSANAIEEIEVITGGYKAEYGQATSGIVSAKTKSGGEKLEGLVAYKSDHFGLFKDQAFSFNTDHYEMNLGGPEPLFSRLLPSIGLELPGQFFFFLNINARLADDYTGATAENIYSAISPTFGGLIGKTFLSPRQNNHWSGIFKLTWKIDPTHKLTFSYNRSIAINQNSQSLQTNLEYVEPTPGFPYIFSKLLDNFNTFTHDNEQVSLAWSHTLDSQTWYEIKLSRYYAQLRSDWDGNLWNEYRRAINVARLPAEYYFLNDGQKVRVIPGDGFFDYGNSDNWHDHFVEWFTIKGDINRSIGKTHTFKAGFEISFKEMQLIDIADPIGGEFGSSQDVYRVHPGEGAFYIQDDLRFEGFILNAGVRLDYWMPGKYTDRAVADPNSIVSEKDRERYKNDTFELFGHRFKTRLMPRIGVSHPISNNLMLYFNYGHFSKLPRPQFVYAKLGPISVNSGFPRFGNPALRPETSVKYELGIRNKFTKDDVLSITTFYKDIFDYIQTVSFSSFGRISSGLTYANLDHARTRGIELEYITRFNRYLSGNVSASYSITTTKSNNADIGLLLAQANLRESPVKETFARWDRPWQASLNTTFRVPPGDHPNLFGINLFDDWYVNLHIFAQAGKRYTPYEFSGVYESNGRPIYNRVTDQTREFEKIATDWMWVDFRFVKNFDVWGLSYSLNLEIKNLFDQKNAQIINPLTGDAYQFGDPTPNFWSDPLYLDPDPTRPPAPLDPTRYLPSRQIILGVSVQF